MNISMKLTSGAHVTVNAWSYARAATSMSNYLALLQALRALQSDPVHSQEVQALADAVVRDAGLNPDDLQAADLAPLLEVMHSLNEVEEMLGKPVALLVRSLTAIQRAQQPEGSEIDETGAPESGMTPS